EVVEVAERLGAGVAKALLGKDVLADDLPFVTGSIGLLGTRPSYEMMMGCDALLTVGSSFPYTQFMPELEQARAVQIDADGTFIGLRYPYEVNIVADAKAALTALIPLLERKSDRSWREKIELDVSHWWATMDRQARVESGEGDRVNPMRVVHELSPRIPLDAIVCSDSGSAANWYARHLQMRGEMRGSLSGTLATMGPGVPYAIGAKFGNPTRPVVALVGDGAMQMNGMAELITVAKYWKEWEDPRLVVCVFHNDDLNQVTWEMRAMEGSPKFVESQSLPDVSYAGFARSLGLHAIDVGKDEQLGSAWEEALAADRPVVLDVRTDPNYPPIPPHADLEQMKDMVKALIGGDEDAWDIVRLGVKTKVQEFIPGTPKGSK
ncbi:MAG TPA: thiamine pyrophosphate-dependent enzyme, partial [Acidimicrobiales bacterium]|nr:thiamine pyrophosphate-dependent enzyme [Acidimicrobiales bacterium]